MSDDNNSNQLRSQRWTWPPRSTSRHSFDVEDCGRLRLHLRYLGFLPRRRSILNRDDRNQSHPVTSSGYEHYSRAFSKHSTPLNIAQLLETHHKPLKRDNFLVEPPRAFLQTDLLHEPGYSITHLYEQSLALLDFVWNNKGESHHTDARRLNPGAISLVAVT